MLAKMLYQAISSRKPVSTFDVLEEVRKQTKIIRERNELLVIKSVQDLAWEINTARDKIIEVVRKEMRTAQKVGKNKKIDEFISATIFIIKITIY